MKFLERYDPVTWHPHTYLVERVQELEQLLFEAYQQLHAAKRREIEAQLEQAAATTAGQIRSVFELAYQYGYCDEEGQPIERPAANQPSAQAAGSTAAAPPEDSAAEQRVASERPKWPAESCQAGKHAGSKADRRTCIGCGATTTWGWELAPGGVRSMTGGSIPASTALAPIPTLYRDLRFRSLVRPPA
jgi:hypothetical protein